MDERARKLFAAIKEKAKIDEQEWNFAQTADYPVHLSDEREEEIMERMFLMYYAEKYRRQQKEIQQLRFMVDNGLGWEDLRDDTANDRQ